MQVDIWSDVRCPFCYIGKKKFESALNKFEQKEEVAVEWHSFQLDPSIASRSDLSIIDYFVQVKNVSAEQARQMFSGAQKMGEDAGLKMDLENTIVANSFKAHQIIQLAKEKGKDNEINEALFKVHFSEVKNINDEEVLIATAASVGIDATEAREALDSEKYAYAVKQDEMQAQNIGVTGVPFFVFNNKYAVSGAQPEEAFLEVLEKVAQEKASV
jgi:predicted DsbA family dithiol-disulfide isomerase